ncbi:MAG: hypothetical protein ACC682_16630 [Gemmatimonadota bacterium]
MRHGDQVRTPDGETYRRRPLQATKSVIEAVTTTSTPIRHLLERPPLEVAGFAYGGLRIRVCASRPSDLTWLSEFLLPAFERADGGRPDVEVRLHADADAFRAIRDAGPAGASTTAFALDGRLTAARVWNGRGPWSIIFDEEGGVFYLRSPDRSVFLVLAKHTRHSVRGAVMRAVRELAMNAARAQGDGLILHGAAVSVGGQGVVIAGPKHAGKTTTLVSLLRNEGAEYVSNDRVVLQSNGDGVRITGLPTFASVRDGTLGLFPDVRRRLLDAGFHARFTLEEAPGRSDPPQAMDDGRYSLSPAQLCHLLDAPAVGSSPATAIVCLTPFLEPPPDGRARATLAPLEPELAAERIMSTRLGVAYGAVPSRFFAKQAAGAPLEATPATVERRCEEIASRVPCFEWSPLRGRPGRGLVNGLSAHAGLASIGTGDLS